MNEDDRSCGIISILKRGDEGGGGSPGQEIQKDLGIRAKGFFRLRCWVLYAVCAPSNMPLR